MTDAELEYMKDIKNHKEIITNWIYELNKWYYDENFAEHHTNIRKAREFLIEELTKPNPLISVLMVFYMSEILKPIYEQMTSWLPLKMQKLNKDEVRRIKKGIRCLVRKKKKELSKNIDV
jgi:hypothetical protein